MPRKKRDIHFPTSKRISRFFLSPSVSCVQTHLKVNSLNAPSIFLLDEFDRKRVGYIWRRLTKNKRQGISRQIGAKNSMKIEMRIETDGFKVQQKKNMADEEKTGVARRQRELKMLLGIECV